MSYTSNLRAMIGHQPAILVGSAVMVIKNDCEVLLHHRTDDHTWDFPGGYMEIGETIQETAKREVKEETGLEVGALNLFNILSGPDLFYTYPNGDQVYPVVLIYITKEFKGDLHPDGIEGDDVRFFNMNDLPENLFSPLHKLIQDYLKSKINFFD